LFFLFIWNVVGNRKYFDLYEKLNAGQEHYLVDILFISIDGFVKSQETQWIYLLTESSVFNPKIFGISIRIYKSLSAYGV